MAKPTSLTPDTLSVSTAVPAAATGPRGVRGKAGARSPMDTPLQIRLPRHEVKAIKVAAAQAEMSVSKYMLSCFHAYMHNR